jgi:tetratricopeptide (TPR) repeat protein
MAEQTNEIVFKKCPVCKKDKVKRVDPSGFLSFAKSSKIVCDKCNAKFTEQGEYQEEETYKLDLSESEQESKYDGETLKKSEWERGTSDLDLCVKSNSLPAADVIGLNIILQKGETAHWYSPAKLMEERAVRHTYGGAVRVMKGVYVGGRRGESHGEMREIDSGNLLLTNKRLIFKGGMRSFEHKLDKVVSVEEYNDSMGIGVSNRQKSQYFVVDEPHKWAVFTRMAVDILHKPEWLKQEEKNKEMFHSEEGLSPINILREKAKEHAKKKDFKKAQELYKKIAETSKMGYDYCALGDILYKQDKFPEATKAYKEAIKLEPDSPYPKNAIEKIKRKKIKLKVAQ